MKSFSLPCKPNWSNIFQNRVLLSDGVRDRHLPLRASPSSRSVPRSSSILSSASSRSTSAVFFEHSGFLGFCDQLVDGQQGERGDSGRALPDRLWVSLNPRRREALNASDHPRALSVETGPDEPLSRYISAITPPLRRLQACNGSRDRPIRPRRCWTNSQENAKLDQDNTARPMLPS